MERLLARSERTLNMTQVCVFDVEVLSASLHHQLAGRKRLKVKLHTAMGKTLLKWSASKIETHGNGEASATFDARGSVVFEGGGVLCFDLCAPRLMRRSQELGGGQLPIQLVVGQVEVNSALGRRWQVDMFERDNPENVIASLGVVIRLTTARLGDIGGARALKLLQVPERPVLDDSVFTFKEDMENCTAYSTQVLAAKQCLAEANKIVTRGMLLASARGGQHAPGTETPATTAGDDVLSEDDFSLFDEPPEVAGERAAWHRQGDRSSCGSRPLGAC
jgi:hypothetical protein